VEQTAVAVQEPVSLVAALIMAVLEELVHQQHFLVFLALFLLVALARAQELLLLEVL
jgi:hypothetical protein